MWIILSLLNSTLFRSALVLVIASGSVAYVSYQKGVATERHSWQVKTTELQAQLNKQKEEADAHTKQITETYAKELARARLRNGTTRNDLSVVRVQQPPTCPREEGTTQQTNGAPSAPAQVSGTPEVTEDEYERINKARFEENRVQLEALIEWVNTLYRTYNSTR